MSSQNTEPSLASPVGSLRQQVTSSRSTSSSMACVPHHGQFPQGCLEFREFGATALLVNLVTYFRVLAYPVVEGVAVEFCFKPPDFGLAKLD